MMASKNNDPHQSQNSILIPDDADYSLLQQPLNHGIKNVKQILKCIESGSREIKDIILNECNIIYECKVCLSLFRGLANLIFHKRGFCKEHLCENMVLFESCNEEEEPCKVVQPEPVEEEKTEKGIYADEKVNSESSELEAEKSNDLNNISENKSLVNEDLEQSQPKENVTSIEEDIITIDDDDDDDSSSKEDQKCNGTSIEDVDYHSSDIEILETPNKNPETKIDIKENEHIEKDVKENIKFESFSQKNVIPIILKPIGGNQNAVFQVIKKQSLELKNTSKGPESIELKQTIGENKKVIIVVPNQNKVSPIKNSKNDKLVGISPEKPKDLHLTRRKRLLNRSDCNVQMLKCLKCNTSFTTLKTLYFHMMSFHSQKRMYFPCPFCKSLFVQMYGVTRHLIQIHGKTKEQINNRMRDSIRKTAVWKRIGAVKEESHETPEKNDDSKAADLKQERSLTENKVSPSSKHRIMHSYVRVENSVTLHHCTKCRRVFTRKSSQVSHEKFCIMNSPCKTENTNHVSAKELSSPIKAETEKKSPIEVRLSARPKRGAEKQMHKDFVDSQTLKWRSANKIETAKTSTTSASPNVMAKKKCSKAYEKKIMSLVNAEKLLCLKCERKFSSFSNLRRHAAIHIGWTRFKCKCCDYQSYNKSDIIHHVQRVHTQISEDDRPKYVIHLINDRSASRVTSTKIVKPLKAESCENKKNSQIRRKKSLPKKIIDKKKLHSAHPSKHRVSRTDAKIVYQKSPPLDNKKKKPLKPLMQSKSDCHVEKKIPNSYRSVTTNSPTTIILSKTCSSSTVKPTVNSLHSPLNVDKGEKVTPTRVSPRKFETSLRVVKNSTDSSVETVMQRKNNIVKIKVTTEPSIIKTNSESAEKSIVKKDRPISDWFMKKSPQDNTASAAVPRREAGPVIIDLFSPTTSLNASRSKSP